MHFNNSKLPQQTKRSKAYFSVQKTAEYTGIFKLGRKSTEGHDV